MTVYADVLLVTNLFVNYALLSCSARITKGNAPRLRLLLGATLGSVYGLVIFLPEFPKALELLTRLAVTCIMVIAAFGFGNARKFLRRFFTFFAVSVGFGGIMLLLFMTVSPAGMIYHNGTVYFDIDLLVLAVSTVVCFAVVSLISFFIERRAPKNSVARVKITSDGKTAELKALIDTGSSLRESFSGYPVMVAERSAVKNVMPDEQRREKFRVVVYSTVSGTGVLSAFRPDCAEIITVGKKVKTDKIYIAVTDSSIAAGEYDAILNPDALDEEKNYAEAF